MVDTKQPEAPGGATLGASRSRAKSLVAATLVGPGDRGAAFKMPAQTPPAKPNVDAHAPWPAQAELVMSAIEAGRHEGGNRRAAKRRPFRARAGLRLFSDAPQTPAWTLYTRDVHARGLGFITPHRLPLGYGGVVEIPAADGSSVTIACTLLRCREAAPGWYEGSLYFNRDQPEFAE